MFKCTCCGIWHPPSTIVTILDGVILQIKGNPQMVTRTKITSFVCSHVWQRQLELSNIAHDWNPQNDSHLIRQRLCRLEGECILHHNLLSLGAVLPMYCVRVYARPAGHPVWNNEHLALCGRCTHNCRADYSLLHILIIKAFMYCVYSNIRKHTPNAHAPHLPTPTHSCMHTVHTLPLVVWIYCFTSVSVHELVQKGDGGQGSGSVAETLC